jgi:hypothetical protein
MFFACPFVEYDSYAKKGMESWWLALALRFGSLEG